MGDRGKGPVFGSVATSPTLKSGREKSRRLHDPTTQDGTVRRRRAGTFSSLQVISPHQHGKISTSLSIGYPQIVITA
jgi:hypothetical protein